MHLLRLVEKALGCFTLDFEERRDMGALYYRESGEDISEAAFGAARRADDILGIAWPL